MDKLLGAVRQINQEKYRKLKIIYEIAADQVLVTNENDEDCILLTNGEIKNFLKHYAGKFEELHVSSVHGHLGTNIWKRLRPSCIESWRYLRNLTCLHCENLILSERNLLLLAANCTKLSEFRLIGCINEENGEPLMIGEGISVSTLEKMKNLKNLGVSNEGTMMIRMSLFCELITKVRLECLKLDAPLAHDLLGDLNGRNFQHHLKELEISLDTRSLKFLQSDGIFTNLLKLNINILNDCTDSSLQILAKACEKLESLTFGQYTNFENTKHFLIPANLNELTFFWSEGIKHKHIIDALTKFQIEKFTCKHRDEDGSLFKDFKISPHIKELDLGGVNTLNFPSFYANNNTLRKLHWYGGEQNIPEQTENRECLKTCRNLEYLYIQRADVPLDVIRELNHLHTVKISSFTCKWSYIIGLLEHLSLKELHIHISLSDDINIPVEGFPSTITLVHMEFHNFNKALKFWLNMLQQNPSMSITCDLFLWLDSDHIAVFLEILIRHESFPNDLKEIMFWGFNLNCNDLRHNFGATIRPLWLHRHNINWGLKTLCLRRPIKEN